MASAVSTACRVSATRLSTVSETHDLLVGSSLRWLHRRGHRARPLSSARKMTAVVGREQLEGDLEDLVEQALLIALQADLPVELVGDAQLLVVLPQRRRRR